MEVSTISLERTDRFNRLILDYVNGESKLQDFYGFRHELENYPKQITARNQYPIYRDVLSDALLKQYEQIGGASDRVLQNIESLRNDRTYTVTTGHQLNIFTGPLYFLYKIIHTVKLADELNQAYADFHFVPIYWMNSEDHDLDEIGQFNLFGKKYVWNTDQTGATGRMNPESLNQFCDQLDEVFSNNEDVLELITVFRSAYSDSETLTIATRNFVNRLFGKHGIVIIDSDDSRLKKPFFKAFEQDLIANRPFELVKATNRKLDELGYHHQVNPREINCFYLSDGIRNRIVRTDKGYHVLHTHLRFSEEELIKELEVHPENFSPNVVLRPLFQEFILPNLTYVGGAGELSYWLQYKDYFKEMQTSFPMLALRNHFLLLDGNVSNRLTEMKLLPEDLFHSVEELIKEHVLELTDAEVDVTEELQLLSDLYGKLKEKAQEIEQSLVASLEAEETRMEKGVDQWKGRFTRALKKQNETSVNRIRSLHKKLFPNGYLQERHDNFLAFYAQSPNTLFDELYQATEPFGTEFRVVSI